MALIQIEIDLGFTFLQTFALALGVEHKHQAFENAQVACETGTRFLDRLPEEDAENLRPMFQELAAAIQK